MTHVGDGPSKRPITYNLAKVATGIRELTEVAELKDLPPEMKALLEQMQRNCKR